MKNNSVTSIKAYMERNIFKQSLIGFFAMALISVIVTFFLARYKMGLDLQKSATSAAEAFRSRILEGDIKAVEGQIHDVLSLRSDEEAFLLDKEKKHIYRSMTKENLALDGCGIDGETCFESYTGPGRIFLPIFFDEKKENLFGYLYLSKSVQIDWLYVGMVFSIFSMGYVAVLLGLGSVAKSSSRRLAAEVEQWSQRLKHDPKSQDPLSSAPFSELSPLKDAIEGLTSQIEQYECRAEEKAKMLVLRGIAHDLLSPVSQVQLYLATLEHQVRFSEVAKETITEIKESLQKLSMIASQVKTLNEIPEAFENIDMVQQVRSEVELLQKNESIAAKGIRLALQIESEEITSALSKPELTRVLQNLVENAADASAPGAEIEIIVSRSGNISNLTVKDSGCGIPKGVQRKVFEPNFTSKPSTGTGLGLFIVKHICDQKQGSVSLLSSEGIGTKVTVSFPSISQMGDLGAT